MKSLLFVALSLGNFAFGSVEVVWRRLETHYSYKDTSGKVCSTRTSVANRHLPGVGHLVLELVDGKVKGARISNHPNVFPFDKIYKAIDFTAEEVATIETFRDKNNKLWIRKFDLTERLAKWLVSFPTKEHYRCVVATPKKVGPSHQMVFETEGLEIGVEVSYSNWVKLEGETSQGANFEEELRLIQQEFRN